jgi:predicted amidohydrolase
MKVAVISYSLTHDPSTLNEWKEKLWKEIDTSLRNGAEIILYPELFLMGLTKYLSEDFSKLAQYIEKELLPYLGDKLQTSRVLLVLGSGPRLEKGQLRNAAPIFHEGRWQFQSKLFLTPWETHFTPGEELLVFTYQGLRTAVVICFDSEQPDLSLLLKKEGIDCLLVPSATMNKNGSQRVNRCASARSVELGAVVITSPLVGNSACDLVDHNEGRQGFFLPAQEDVTQDQEVYSAYSIEKHDLSFYEFKESQIRKLKDLTEETKPFLKPTHPSLKIVRT